jgi:cell volume regulation protein A
VQLKRSKRSIKLLLFVAPNGLITILLLLSIEKPHQISIVINSLMFQVIILSALLTVVGLMATKANQKV